MIPIRRIAQLAMLMTGLAVTLPAPAAAEEQRPPDHPYWENERRDRQRGQDSLDRSGRPWWWRDRDWRDGRQSDRYDERWRDGRRRGERDDGWDDDWRGRDGRRWREREERRWSD